jgi:short-subunit dehydrogenase
MNYMKDKVVIITGASSGIGKALAEKFAGLQARVVLAARNSEALEKLAKILDDRKVNFLVIKTDVTKESDCKNLIDQTVKRFGRIDILINNAGISMRALFENANLSVLKQVMDVNFWGTVYCTKYALPYLISVKGSVVGVTSIAGYKGLPGRSGYSASKFAVQGFLEVLRIENIKKGLHVLIACPGFTASNIRNSALAADGSKQGESPRDEVKMMTADEVAERIIVAIQKKKHRVIMTFEGKMTVILNKFFPKMMDRIVYNHMAKEPNSPFK